MTRWLGGVMRALAGVPVAGLLICQAPLAVAADSLVYPGMEVRQGTNVCTLGYVDPISRVAFTAGHCRGSGPVDDRDGNFIGHLGSFQDNTPDGATVDTNHMISDWETVQLAGDVAVNNILPGGRILVEDLSVLPTPGAPVCHFGVITGESCGTVEAVNNGWFTMANGVVSQKGDSGGPVYVAMPDGRAAIIGMFNSTWGNYPAAVSWQNVSGQARGGGGLPAGEVSNLVGRP